MRIAEFGSLVDRFAMSVASPETYRADIRRAAADLLPEKSAAVVMACDEHAEHLHHGQLRGDGSPYIVHPRRVALMSSAVCGEDGVHEAFLIGLLHDVVEDCGVDVSSLEALYGPVVARSVATLTSSPSTDHETKQERFARKRAKWARVATADLLTITVHLMDVLDNCISWRMVRPEMAVSRKIPRWMWQTREFQVPLADKHLPVVAERLRQEIAFQQAQGFEFGSWNDA